MELFHVDVFGSLDPVRLGRAERGKFDIKLCHIKSCKAYAWHDVDAKSIDWESHLSFATQSRILRA